MMKKITQKLVNRYCIPALIFLVLPALLLPGPLFSRDYSALAGSMESVPLVSSPSENASLLSADWSAQSSANSEVRGTDELLIISFKQMLAHVGQKFVLYVKDKATGEVLDSVVIASVASQDFEVQSSVIEVGGSYYIDFYADYNENGEYDPPSSDHAWRIVLDDVEGDTTLEFVHNSNFTDIMAGGATGIASYGSDLELRVFPNPARNMVSIDSEVPVTALEIISLSGQTLKSLQTPGRASFNLDIGDLNSGIYILEVVLEDQARRTLRMIRQ